MTSTRHRTSVSWVENSLSRMVMGMPILASLGITLPLARGVRVHRRFQL